MQINFENVVYCLLEGVVHQMAFSGGGAAIGGLVGGPVGAVIGALAGKIHSCVVNYCFFAVLYNSFLLL